MVKLLVSFFTLINMLMLAFSAMQTQTQIDSPRPGDVLRGMVEITGSVIGDDVVSFDVAFAYSEDTTDTWFILSSSREIVTNGVLAVWDTTTIADGTYRLRVSVELSQGEPEITIIENLRVRNYTAVETKTVVPTSHGTVEIIAETSTPTQLMAVTPYADNPLEINRDRFLHSLMLGAGITGILFLFLVVRAVTRRAAKKGKR